MPRSRKNDPLGVSDNPITMTDPTREAELCEELKRRLGYIKNHYMMALYICGDSNAKMY